MVYREQCFLDKQTGKYSKNKWSIDWWLNYQVCALSTSNTLQKAIGNPAVTQKNARNMTQGYKTCPCIEKCGKTA